MFRASAAAALALALLAPPAAAQTELGSTGLTLSLTPAISTDYVFRGLSQTRNRPAASLTADLEHSSGVYIGAFVSNATFVNTNVRQEVDLLAGYRFSLGPVRFDAGLVYYFYPGFDRPPGGFDLDYGEVALRASYQADPVKLVGTVAYSPEFSAETGNAVYLEGGVDISLPLDFTLSGRLGYQWIQRNVRFGAPDYLNFSVAVSRELFAGVTLSVGYYGTDIDDNECFGGLKVCDNRFVATLSRVF